MFFTFHYCAKRILKREFPILEVRNVYFLGGFDYCNKNYEETENNGITLPRHSCLASLCLPHLNSVIGTVCDLITKYKILPTETQFIYHHKASVHLQKKLSTYLVP